MYNNNIDDEYYLKKQYYLIYTLSVIVSFMCGSLLNSRNVSYIVCLNNTYT
jgi:hypothetical protein